MPPRYLLSLSKWGRCFLVYYSERDYLSQQIDEMEKVIALALGRDGKVASRKSESIEKKRRHWVIN
jgi:hypothetical protein